MPIPSDYAERVYAGVLGKLVGVYLGRPVEGWTYERITAEYGEVGYYVPDPRGAPLVVTDDDVSGTFTFLRALPDHGNRCDPTPAEIGETWLNYIVEGRTILWWGGLGNSTEHTAYLRLKHGIPAPVSGAVATNGRVIAEQVGAQIFIDGWAMVAPGDPELAADLARRAASVSHDGAAIHGAQVVAAMEAQAFVESDIGALIDTAVSFIPQDSTIRRTIDDIRTWHANEPDWRKTREQIAATYGYDKFPGPCHMVPNHALIIHSLLHGEGDLARSLMIVTTSGWDTDCNAGNVGCLIGIKNGLAAFDGALDWRGPVADRLYLATADGGRAITDAVGETFHVVNTGRALVGTEPVAPKEGARFHFELPGAVQGFRASVGGLTGTATVENVEGHSTTGQRCLALRWRGNGSGDAVRATTPTFIPLEAINMPGYTLLASPTLYPGQVVRARVEVDGGNQEPVTCRLMIRVYGVGDVLEPLVGPETRLPPGAEHTLEWCVPDMGGQPIAEIGLEVTGDGSDEGTVYLDYLTWGGPPTVRFARPDAGGTMWRRAWVDGVDQFEARWPESFRIVQNEGTGLISQGAAEWTDYRATADVTPYLAKAAGIGVRVQGLRRYYALLLCGDQRVRLVKAMDGTTSLAEADFPWEFFRTYQLAVEVVGPRLRAWVDDHLVVEVEDTTAPLMAGGVALVCEDGCLGTDSVVVQPVG